MQDVAQSRVDRSITRVFGSGARAVPVELDSTRVLRVTRADSLLGFAVVREVNGRDQPITFLVAVDTAGLMRDVDILVYREPYGGEVAYDSWRRQFRGRGADAPLVPGRDVRSISGATISVNAVTLGVRQAVRDLAQWRGAGRLP